MMKRLYALLEHPAVYSFVQRTVIGVDGMREVKESFKKFVDDGYKDAILELGCGTGLWPVSNFRRFLRTDINPRYFPPAAPPGVEFLLLDASDLSPLHGESFDLIYSVGLFHHLSDEAVRRSVAESLRHLKPDGRIVIFDAILPTSSFNLPGWVIRKLDRGGSVRSEQALLELLQGENARVHPLRRCRWAFMLEGLFVEVLCGRA